MLSPIRFWLNRMSVETLKPFGADIPTDQLRLTVCDMNRDLARALAGYFDNAPAVEVVCGDIVKLTGGALVSPANSFGDMDGGVDKAIDEHYGLRAQPAVKRAIAEACLGELPVGQALVIDMDDRRFRHLIVAPTMRVPGPVAGSINAYLAMRAALVAVARENRLRAGVIPSMVMPALGAGIGRMPFREVAEQMRAGYDNVFGDGWRKVVHSSLAPYVMRG